MVIREPARLLHCVMKLKANNTEVLMLVDSGAGVSMLPWSIFNALPKYEKPALLPNDLNLTAANAGGIRCFGKCILRFLLADDEYETEFYITEDSTPAILGLPFMHPNSATIQLGKDSHLALHGSRYKLFDFAGKPITNKVSLVRTVHIKPGEQKTCYAKVAGDNDVEARPSIIEPARSAYIKTGAMVCKVMVSPASRLVPVRIYNPHAEPITVFKHQTVGVRQDIATSTPWRDEGYESGDEEEKEDGGGEQSVQDTPADNQEPASSHSVNCSQPVQVDDDVTSEDFNRKLEEHVKELYERSIEGLTFQESRRVRHLFLDFPDIFARNKQDIGKTTMCKHDIETGDERPVKQRPRRIPPAHVPELQKQIKTLADHGIIKPSNSDWASNVLLVKKKDGTFRMCIDYRELNAKTKNLDEYVLPRIDDTLDALSRAKYFCTLDLIQGYHQIELEEEAKPKTAFLAPGCSPTHWEFEFMPFGLCGAPRTFQRMMDALLKGLEFRIALAYLDDIIVFGATIDECVDNVRAVFKRIREAGLKLKASKCSFFRPETLYLGHVISGDGVRCDPEKITAIGKWKRPRTTRQVRSFLGMTNYYRKFIRSYAHIADPLYLLLKKNKKFQWEKDEQDAFERLKERLTSTPVMAYPKEGCTYVLDTEASAHAIGAALSQLQPDENGVLQERVIAFASRRLCDRERRYCMRRKELLAIVDFTKHFNAYLRGPRFTIRSDHASLRYIKALGEMPDQFARWIMYLENFNYEIEVRKGALHDNDVTLSKYTCDGKQCICHGVECLELEEEQVKDENDPLDMIPAKQQTSILAVRFTALWTDEEMAAAQENDPDIKLIYQAFKNDKVRPAMNVLSPHSAATKALYLEWLRLEMHRGMLFRRWENNTGDQTYLQLILPHRYQQLLCQQYHDKKKSAHMGRRRVINLLQRRMYWYKMREAIRTWGQACAVCQEKRRPKKTARVPAAATDQVGCCNERVSMEICGPLIPSETGNTCILVITDGFSKFSKAFAIADQSARTVAELFAHHWISDFGEPGMLQTDQGSSFEKALMEEICELHSIHKTRTRPHQPSVDGQVQRSNSTVMDIASALMHSFDDWDLKIGAAVSAYNATIHAQTGFTPNKLWFGREITHSADSMLPVNPATLRITREAYVERLERDNRIAYQVTKEVTGRNVLQQKKYHDKCAHLTRYKEGDMVLVRLRGKYDKKKKRFQDTWSDPHYIIDVISDVDYRVAETAESRRTVQHHDRLQPYVKEKGKLYPDNSWVFDVSRSFRRGKVETMMQTDEWRDEGGSILKKTAGVNQDTQTEDLMATDAAKFQPTTSKRVKKPTQPYHAEVPLGQFIPVKKKRGRPPKATIPDTGESRLSGKRKHLPVGSKTAVTENIENRSVKKTRGRPRKQQ